MTPIWCSACDVWAPKTGCGFGSRSVSIFAFVQNFVFGLDVCPCKSNDSQKPRPETNVNKYKYPSRAKIRNGRC